MNHFVRGTHRSNHAVVTAALIGTVLALAACGGTSSAPPAAATGSASDGEKAITIVATIFPPYDFARQVAGTLIPDHVHLSMLLPPGAESHSFEPTPADIIRIQQCDVFIYGGGESDAWVSRILESMDTSRMQVIAMMDVVKLVEEELVEGMQAEDAAPEDAAGEAVAESEVEYDEHVWTYPGNAALIAGAISQALCTVDPAYTATYQANTKAYMEQLAALDAAFREVVATGRRKTLVFADRFPFRYFTDAYGLTYSAAFPGCSTETEPSAATVAFLINKIKSEHIPVVFSLEMSNGRMADTLAEETGAKKLLFHAAHNVSKEAFENGVTYLDLMRGNVDRLKEALQ